MAEVGLTQVPFLPIVIKIDGEEKFLTKEEAESLIADLNSSLLELDQAWLDEQMASSVNYAEQPEDFSLSTLGGS